MLFGTSSGSSSNPKEEWLLPYAGIQNLVTKLKLLWPILGALKALDPHHGEVANNGAFPELILCL